MCQTTISGMGDMDEISYTSNKKTKKCIEPRKIRKPLMEKKRRARINQSLDELKLIVVNAEKYSGQDTSRLNKLEKADILEMTVRYLKRKTTPPSGANLYMAGYKQCMEQVQEVLAEQWTADEQQSGRRMIEHLEARVRRLEVPPLPSDTRHSMSFSSSSCDESNTHVTTDLHHQSAGVVRKNNSFFSSASSDEDESVEEEAVTSSNTAQPLPSCTTTDFQDTSSKSMWRPW